MRAKLFLESRWSLFLLLLILLLRVGCAQIMQARPDGGVLVDSQYYLQLADVLSTSGRYEHPGNQDDVWPPGYPAFLSGLRAISLGSNASVAAIQLAVSGLTALALVGIGRELKARAAGMAAALLYSLSPNSLLWSLTLMSETLFALLLVLALLAWARYIRTDRQGWLAVCGSLLGLSAWVRPIGLYLVLAVLLVTLWKGYRAGQRRLLAGQAALLLTGTLLAVLPWFVRNQLDHGRFEFASVSSRTWYNFNLAQVIASGEGITRNEATLYIESDAGLLRETLRVFRAYPVQFIRQQVAGIGRTLFGVESGVWAQLLGYGDYQGRSFGVLGSTLQGHFGEAFERALDVLRDTENAPLVGLTALAMAYSLSLYALAALGIFHARRMPLASWMGVLLLLMLAYLFLTPGAAGQARFRIPGEPLLGMLAGIGLVGLLDRRKRPPVVAATRSEV